MLTLTETALAYIHDRRQPIYLEMPIVVGGDITICESPSVRWGMPRDVQCYQLLTVNGIEIYIPRDLPKIPLKITVSRFLWLKWLAVEGWSLA